MIEPPTVEQILAQDEDWFSEQHEDGRPWVFPGLEKAYLRHEAGIDLIRRFLDRAHGGSLGQGIIGCDSWAWAFLGHVWHGRRSVTLSLQALDEERMATLFHKMAHSTIQEEISFRQSNNGQYVLPAPEGTENQGERSPFLKLLAAHSRGIVGIAQAIWRESLRAEPDESPEEESESEQPTFAGRTIWVSAWDQLSHPSLPSGAGRDEAFVLHGLLLQGGLPDDVLTQIVPLSTNQVLETLSRLEEVRLVGYHEGVWRVLPLGYPAARQFLQANGYLVDQC